jgi:hypothetical protein
VLLISCSHTKTQDDDLVPAIDRYDGPAFRVLRRYLRETRDPKLRVFVLSAEFGLISCRKSIPYYNRRMTRDRAFDLRKRCSAKLEKTVRRRPFKELFICASTVYQEALDRSIIERHLPIRYAASGQGRKLASLHNWLREESNG